MELMLQGLRPHYLADAGRPSDIWGQDLRFAPGARVFVRAPSGVGKTSLIHLLYGLRHDAAGRVQWGTLDLSHSTPDALAGLRAQHLSIVFQDLRLFPELTVWENIGVKRALGSPDSDAETEQRIEMLGLAHRRNVPAKLLSFGEQQRTAILRALAADFRWLLLDEPFSHLDADNACRALTLIEAVAQQRGGGIFYAELDANPNFQASQTLAL